MTMHRGQQGLKNTCVELILRVRMDGPSHYLLLMKMVHYGKLHEAPTTCNKLQRLILALHFFTYPSEDS